MEGHPHTWNSVINQCDPSGGSTVSDHVAQINNNTWIHYLTLKPMSIIFKNVIFF